MAKLALQKKAYELEDKKIDTIQHETWRADIRKKNEQNISDQYYNFRKPNVHTQHLPR